MSYRKRPKAGMASDVRRLSTEYGIVPLSVQGVISLKTTWSAHLSPRLSSRNRSSVDGERFSSGCAREGCWGVKVGTRLFECGLRA